MFHMERGKEIDWEKSKICIHQTTDAFKIYSGEIYKGKSFRALKQVKYKLEDF